MAEPVQILSPARHETRDVAFKYIAAGAAWIALAVALVLLAALWMFPHTLTDEYVTRPMPAFAAPSLQASPRQAMTQFHAQQMRALHGTYWLDRARGGVHLPIEDAMRKVAEEGIPDWPTARAGKR